MTSIIHLCRLPSPTATRNSAAPLTRLQSHKNSIYKAYAAFASPNMLRKQHLCSDSQYTPLFIMSCMPREWTLCMWFIPQRYGGIFIRYFSYCSARISECANVNTDSRQASAWIYVACINFTRNVANLVNVFRCRITFCVYIIIKY